MKQNNLLRTISAAISSSIIIEAQSGIKPGLVHRYRDLPDLNLKDFAIASTVSYKYIYRVLKRGFKARIVKALFYDQLYYAVKDIMKQTHTNTSLGSLIILLPLTYTIGKILRRKNTYNPRQIQELLVETIEEAGVEDTVWLYKAIRTVKPSYITQKDEIGEYVNVWSKNYISEINRKKQKLIDTLKYSSRYDRNSYELIHGLPTIMEGLKFLDERMKKHNDWDRAVSETYLYLLSKQLDTVIARKKGLRIAEEVRREASSILGVILNNQDWSRILLELDDKYRAEEIRPASTADLLVAAIALHLLEESISH